MNGEKTFDRQQARAYCMQYGAVIGAVCSLSFLCAMYAGRYALLGLIGNVLGIYAVWTAGRLIRRFRLTVQPLGFGQSCYMALLTYLFAILVVGIVQYTYFRYLDSGRMVAQVEQLIVLPEYHQLLVQMSGTEDVDSLITSTLDIMRQPTQMTIQLVWTNLLLSLLLTIPTALIAITGAPKERKESH
ncbi:MAG: DUF4199 domain-containing protein [Bacteroidaceae bacterium]|nr:DUF4199 domain-containing protein [Bacteroidaceae bacterium]